MIKNILYAMFFPCEMVMYIILSILCAVFMVASIYAVFTYRLGKEILNSFRKGGV